SSLAVFLTVAMFAWLWGPVAAIVAVPLLIVFSAVARHVPTLEPWGVLLLAENETKLEVKETARDRFFAEDAALNGNREGRAPEWVGWVVSRGPFKRSAYSNQERDAA